MIPSFKSKFLTSLILLLSCAIAGAFPAELAQAPKSNLELLLKAIHSAQKSLRVNIYELTSPEVSDALIDQIHEGVRVEIIEEGQPVAGMSAVGRGIQSEIVREMRKARNGSRFYEMTSEAGGKRRFRWNHAKYVIVDDQSVLVGSENYSPTGQPVEGAAGNRGWQVLLHESTLALQFKKIFEADRALDFSDVIELVSEGESSPSNDSSAKTLPSVSKLRALADRPTISTVEIESAQQIVAPDHSLKDLVALLDSAKSTLDIEQMSFPPEWRKLADASPLYQAVTRAARRGVKVRVLLNDETVFDHGEEREHKNELTVRRLKSLARKEKVDLDARIADIKGMGVTYIHNKGVIVDGRKVLVSSINWTENSITKNRETGVVLTSNDAARFYTDLFEADWDASAQLAKKATFQLESESGRCPEALRLSVVFGAIQDPVSPPETGYASLSETKINESFALADSPQGAKSRRSCLYVNSSSENRDRAQKRYLELRPVVDGKWGFSLDGYTSSKRVYSIKSFIESPEGSEDISGSYSATVYDSTGQRERLGTATLDLAVSEAGN